MENKKTEKLDETNPSDDGIVEDNFNWYVWSVMITFTVALTLNALVHYYTHYMQISQLFMDQICLVKANYDINVCDYTRNEDYNVKLIYFLYVILVVVTFIITSKTFYKNNNLLHLLIIYAMIFTVVSIALTYLTIEFSSGVILMGNKIIEHRTLTLSECTDYEYVVTNHRRYIYSRMLSYNLYGLLN